MRFFRPGILARLVYPAALFRISTKSNEICLTFDDGPDSESTPQILNILDNRGVRAIFFCDGRAAEGNPGLMALIAAKGHVLGNHGFRHLKGWRTSLEEYVRDVEKASQTTSVILFRPPYGSLRPSQYNVLRKKFKIVFWDLMPYDYDHLTGKEGSFRILKEKLRPGSIITLHDKPASYALSYLDDFIVYARNRGFRFIIPGFS